MPGPAADFTDDLRLAHVLADDADSLTTARFKALDLHVMSKPDLTPAQRAEIEAARDEMLERAANLPRNPEARQGQMQSARQRLISRVNAALNPEQRARIAEARVTRGTACTVWVAEEGAPPRAVPVRLGVTDGTVTEIVYGDLAAGQAVVVGVERQGANGGSAPAAQGGPPGGRLRMF